MRVKKGLYLALASVLALLVMVFMTVYLCLRQSEVLVASPADSPELPGRGFYMGVLPTPAIGQSLGDAYLQASCYAEFSPVWGRPTPFYELARELSSGWGDTFLEEYIRGNGMFPVVHLSFIGPGVTLIAPPGIQDATLSSSEWREAYKQAAIDVVRASKPLFLSLGNEVNRWYETYGAAEGDPNGFQHYVSLYEEIYDAVKRVSPGTRVFCTFAREIVSENREADLNIIRMFNPNKMDLLLLTSYPYAVKGVNKPADIPDDYYLKVASLMPGKPFGFSELGWPSIGAFGGEQGQASFLNEVVGHLTKNQGINLYMLGWAWLHDLDENDHIGLIRRDGTEKLAYRVWKSISAQVEGYLYCTIHRPHGQAAYQLRFWRVLLPDAEDVLNVLKQACIPRFRLRSILGRLQGLMF